MAPVKMARLDLSPAGLDSLSDLLRLVFPDADYLEPEFLAWSYTENPEGAAFGFNAWDGRRLAAHYATQPLLARIESKVERGLLSLHTATHPDFRGRSLFPQLAEATYDAAAREGFGFVVGVANAASTPGFIRKLGFQHVGSLEARLSLGRAPLPMASMSPSFARQWSKDSLRWRLGGPREDYLVEVEAEGFRVHAEIGQMRGLVELAFLPGEPLMRRPGPGPLRPLRLWVGLDPRRRFRPWINPHLPASLRPSPLNLIFRDLTGAGRTLDPDRILFQALDFDAF